jgi:hypothetical protein
MDGQKIQLLGILVHWLRNAAVPQIRNRRNIKLRDILGLGLVGVLLMHVQLASLQFLYRYFHKDHLSFGA